MAHQVLSKSIIEEDIPPKAIMPQNAVHGELFGEIALEPGAGYADSVSFGTVDAE